MVSHTRGRRRRGGVELTPFLKTGRSHCLAICEALARERVEGGGSLPRLSYSAPQVLKQGRPCAGELDTQRGCI